MRSIVLAIFVACLPVAAEDGSACPLCGKSAVEFEDSPRGAYRRYQIARVACDVALLRGATLGLDDSMEKQTLQRNPRRWEKARWMVRDCDVDGDAAWLTMARVCDGWRERLRAVRVEGGWRIDERMGHVVVDVADVEMALAQIATVEGFWRRADADGNGAQDYWTRDVAGFYHTKDSAGNETKCLDAGIARADRVGLAAWSKEAAAPWRGYWFRAMSADEDGAPYARDAVGDVPSTNPARYAFCAWPAERGRGAAPTYIVNEEGVVYAKDLGPDVRDGIDAWPAADPTERG